MRLLLLLVSAAWSAQHPCDHRPFQKEAILGRMAADRASGAAAFGEIYRAEKGQGGSPLHGLPSDLAAYFEELYGGGVDVAKAMDVDKNGDIPHFVKTLRAYVDRAKAADEAKLAASMADEDARQYGKAVLGRAYVERLDSLAAALSAESKQRRPAAIVHVERLACQRFVAR